MEDLTGLLKSWGLWQGGIVHEVSQRKECFNILKSIRFYLLNAFLFECAGL